MEKLKSASKRRHDVMLAPVVAMTTTSFTQNERYNRRFVLEDGRSVSYSVVRNPDGQPVFLFLARRVAITDRQSRDVKEFPISAEVDRRGFLASNE